MKYLPLSTHKITIAISSAKPRQVELLSAHNLPICSKKSNAIYNNDILRNSTKIG